MSNSCHKSATVFILFCFFCLAWTGESADEIGILNEDKYKQLVAESDADGIRLCLSKERWASSNIEEKVFCGIRDDLRIINKYKGRRGLQKMALGILLRERYLARCPEGDLNLALAYFSVKKDVLLSCFAFSDFYESPANRASLLGFLSEIKKWKIPDYRLRGTANPGRDVLIRAGVPSREQLTNAVQISEYNQAVRVNGEQLVMNDLQLLLGRIDCILRFQMKYQENVIDE